MKDYLAHFFDGLPHNSPQYIHLVAEMEKRVFADRAEYLGDPDFVQMPIDMLTSRHYADGLRASIRAAVPSRRRVQIPAASGSDTAVDRRPPQTGNRLAR